MESLLRPEELLKSALMVSMTSVWVLVGLFYYLNRYTRRNYFTTWTAAWLFHALWLMLELIDPSSVSGSLIFATKACCVALCALFLLWGSIEFLKIPVNQRTFGLFMLFLIVWVTVSPSFLGGSLQTQLPVSVLLGAGSVFAGGCFFRLRRKLPFVGAGMLAIGFLLWGAHLATYPITQRMVELRSTSIFLSAVLQLFIAVSMIVLVLEEVRYNSEQALRDLAELRKQKEALEVKMITTEEECRSLYEQVRGAEGIQTAYQELRRTQQAVVQQERLRVLGQIASGVSHDVNNALAPILAYAESLRVALSSIPEPERRKLDTIHKCAHDIARIVSRMRDLYRTHSDAEALKPVDIYQVVGESVGLTRPRWRDLPQRRGVTIRCSVELEPGLPQMMSDATEIREALTNLIFNAVDALPVGGVITIRARTVAQTKEGQKDNQKQVQIEVSDNGIGMSETTRERCLEPFFTTKWASGGSGLGLAMVCSFVQRHHGSISVESKLGVGTCMRITLPVGVLPAAVAIHESTPSSIPQRLRLLCVDDEPDLRDMLKTCLDGFNHQVTVAEDGISGLECFGDALRRQTPFDAVITDLGMPGVDGLQMARSIKAQSRATPIILMTGWAAELDEKGGVTQDVDAVVGKPHSMVKLNELLHQLSRRETVSANPTIPSASLLASNLAEAVPL